MTEPRNRLPHIAVLDRARDESFHRPGGGSAAIFDVDRAIHGGRLRSDLATAFEDARSEREDAAEEARQLGLEELQALGTILVLEGVDPAFPLKLDQLERMSRHRSTPKRPQWLLLSVVPASGVQPEQAVVWVSDEYRTAFLKLFQDFLERDSSAGNPRNRELVANIAAIRRAVLRDLWQSEGEPPSSGDRWWEIWLTRSPDGSGLLQAFAAANGFRISSRRLVLPDREVTWIQASWIALQALPFTAIPLAEIRQPGFADTVEDLDRADQDTLATDLADRIVAARADSEVVVCHLDSGVRHSHVLLAGSLDPADVHSVVGDSGADNYGHGTLMAGLALFGDLEQHLMTTSRVPLRHRLESVKLLPDAPDHNDPLAYGLVTATAAAAAEAAAPGRSRAFCLPITSPPEQSSGEPSLWSASIDALCVGTDIGRSDDGIELIGPPDPSASRLFLISAGNVQDWQPGTDYFDICDTCVVQDPAQAWNALTVGAHTELDSVPTDPGYDGWQPIATAGELSPHSRTSVMFNQPWPIKPEICMEGGNVLSDAVDFDSKHPLLSLRTTGSRDDLAVTSANATSAATAQASRLAALAMDRYPFAWPETIRGLLVHGAEWTPSMRARVHGANSKTARLALLRRYGWGVPTEQAVLESSANAVTLLTQDEFVPFDGAEHAARRFRLHSLPWPTEVLRGLASEQVVLRVTLSYFVEPSASRRGWRRRHQYASHGLRFELKAPLESQADFIARVNRDAQDEEEGRRPDGGSDRWLVGPNQRNTGSLHQDIWDGTGAELADAGQLAVHPVGGWWKNNRRADRADRPLRYSLILSLRTADQTVDLYTPIAVQLELPIEVEIPGS